MSRTIKILGWIAFFLYGLVLCAQTPAKPATHVRRLPADPPSRTSAVIQTTLGDMHCKLFDDASPLGVQNFIGLAEGTKDWKEPLHGKEMKGVPLYNDTYFHRVIPNFMIQGGDPKGDGTGYIGFSFDIEHSPNLRFDRPGRLAYANTGFPHSNASQFFITEEANSDLDQGLGYTIFGQCDAATVALVKKIARRPRDPRNNRPYDPVHIKKIVIVRAAAKSAAPAKSAKPAVRKLGPPVKKP